MQSDQSFLSAWRNIASLDIQTVTTEDSNQTTQSDLNLQLERMAKGTGF